MDFGARLLFGIAVFVRVFILILAFVLLLIFGVNHKFNFGGTSAVNLQDLD